MKDFILPSLIRTVRLYQRTLSPDHGWLRGLYPMGVCRFQPTCSEYMVISLQKYGWAGFGLGLRRISRCHPFNIGGADPVV